MKVCELEGAQLDAAVAMAEGLVPTIKESLGPSFPVFKTDDMECLVEEFAPSQLWCYGGPIIEREQMTLRPIGLGDGTDGWEASTGPIYVWSESGPTLLIAAMRAYVFSKFGEEVDLPSSTAPAEAACR